MSRVVVTGASGNVGTALLRRLTAEVDVLGISRRQPPHVDPYSSAEWVTIDISASDARDRLATAMAGADAVVHLAWQIQPGRDREQLRRTNQGGTAAVFDAAERADVPQVVHMSSVGAYSAAPPHTFVEESWATAGIATSSYSVDKAAAERIAGTASIDTVTIVRPGLILQPDAASEIARYFIGPLIPVSALHRRLLRFVPWPSDLATQFVHADDVAAAISTILDRRPAGAFNLAAEPLIDRQHVRELFGGVLPGLPRRVLRELVDLSWRAHLQPTDAGWIDLAFDSPLLRTDRARTELDWSPVHSTADTLMSFVDALHHRRGGTRPLLQPRRLWPRIRSID
ncbi:MAG TPA: NAD-dependent epimerase/dehydratase family protein [Mycobacterium sp.]|jgi:nucleoside-diphosphate-sugar epimerase|nr:NAD-dependent epimerase/dehydratase family protein [Mycobacterium sp.]